MFYIFFTSSTFRTWGASALARAQLGHSQAAMGGYVGAMGPGGMTSIVPEGKGFFIRLFKRTFFIKYLGLENHFYNNRSKTSKFY